MMTYSVDTLETWHLAYLSVTYALARSVRSKADRSEAFTPDEMVLIEQAAQYSCIIGETGIKHVAPLRNFLLSIPA